jgi:hypothetical protein
LRLADRAASAVGISNVFQLRDDSLGGDFLQIFGDEVGTTSRILLGSNWVTNDFLCRFHVSVAELPLIVFNFK